MKPADRIQGCLLAGACGDALGNEIEFLSIHEITRKYGKLGIQEIPVVNGFEQITDDTQMTLFTACGIQNANGSSNPSILIPAIHEAYLEWYYTQFHDFRSTHPTTCWIMNDAQLYAPRSPGNTCLSALESGSIGTPHQPLNHSKGCGGLMRVAPIGLYYCHLPLPEVIHLAECAAAITHGHPMGSIPAGLFAGILATILNHPESSLKEIILAVTEVTSKIHQTEPEMEGFRKQILQAISFAEDPNIQDASAVELCGSGWVADENLAIAICSALRHPTNVKDALCMAVNHSGDSDSTGAVCGNLIGAWLGTSTIPPTWISQLECLDTLQQMSLVLAQPTC